MGPDLSHVGRRRSYSYIEESLTAPDANLTPGYNTLTVVRKDGVRVTGVQKGYDAFSAQLMDASEQFHSYFREDVQSMTREFKSLMPSYKDKLTARERDDLMAYLVTLGRDVAGDRR
jgi:putative heme-binding domain-containing protein